MAFHHQSSGNLGWDSGCNFHRRPYTDFSTQYERNKFDWPFSDTQCASSTPELGFQLPDDNDDDVTRGTSSHMTAASNRSSKSPSLEHNTEETRVQRPKEASHFEKENTQWIAKPPPPTFSEGSDQNTNKGVDKRKKGLNEPGDSRKPDGNDDKEGNDEETGYGQASVPVQVKMTLYNSRAITETWKGGTMSMKQEFPPEGHYCLVRLLNESYWSWYPQADVRERL